MGGLSFLLRCNYNLNYFNKLPVFYKTILESFSELKFQQQNPHIGNHSGPTRWNKSLSLNEDDWLNILKSLKNACNENKLREFYFKFIHRIIATKKEPLKFALKKDDECLYCGENADSITNHTFIECPFTRTFISNVLQWIQQTLVRSSQQQ